MDLFCVFLSEIRNSEPKPHILRFVNADHWRKNLPALAKAGFRVFAIDLLGSGYSSLAVSHTKTYIYIYIYIHMLCVYIYMRILRAFNA